MSSKEQEEGGGKAPSRGKAHKYTLPGPKGFCYQMTKSALIVGGAGALGRAIIESCIFMGWRAISVDLVESPKACQSIVIKDTEVQPVLETIKDNVDYVYCVAGSWSGGSIADPSIPIDTKYIDACKDVMSISNQMWAVNVKPSIMAAQLAHHLKAKVLVLTAAKAILHGSPDMLGYGMAKQAVVHLAKSLADDKEFPAKSICIMPEVIDTEANRRNMPGADTSRWTKLDVLAGFLSKDCLELPTGSMVAVVTRNNQTEFKNNL